MVIGVRVFSAVQNVETDGAKRRGAIICSLLRDEQTTDPSMHLITIYTS